MRNWMQRDLTVVILLLCGIAIALGGYAILQASNAINDACAIQQRGLAANQHLQTFLVDLDTLALHPSAQSKANERREPKQIQQLDSQAIAALNTYAAITSHQPKHRSCP